MLEIILISAFAKKIGAIVLSKGRRKFPYQAMFVALWIGGEIGGAILGTSVALILARSRGERMILCYLCALAGAAVGTILSFVVANSLSSLNAIEREDPESADQSKFDTNERTFGVDHSSKSDSHGEPDDRIRQ